MYFTFFHYRRDSGLSKVLGSMTKLFSKNLHRSTDLLFLKSLVGSNNCIQHEKALLVSSTTLLFWLSLVVPIWKFSIKVSKMCIKPSTRLVRRQVPSSTCSYVYFRKYQKALYLSTHIDYGFVPKKGNMRLPCYVQYLCIYGPKSFGTFFDLPFFSSFSVKRVHEACHADLKFCKLCQTLFFPNQWKFMSFLYFHFRIFTENVAAWLQRSRNGAFLLHTDFFFLFQVFS